MRKDDIAIALDSEGSLKHSAYSLMVYFENTSSKNLPEKPSFDESLVENILQNQYH